MIQKRGVTGDDLFKNKTVDSIIWWFEFIDWLRINKSLEHISVFIDEADQLLPVSPSGARWHLNLWFKDIMRALRKRNISLYMACHGYTDIDGRIRPKVMYRIYMKGACAPSESLIMKTAPITLPQGKYYIERDAWGWARFNKIDEQPRVLVVLKQDVDDTAMKAVDDQEDEEEQSNIIENNNTSQTKEIIDVNDEVILPIGIEDLPVKIDRKPGEFISVGPDGDIIPDVDSKDDFTLKVPDKISEPIVDPPARKQEIIKQDAPIIRAPDTLTIDDLMESSDKKEKKIINNVKPEDPLKDLYD
jgi:hypothetical protein